MAATFLFTLGAVIGLLPVALLLFLVLDRYAAPRAPKDLFDSSKVILAVPVGIGVGVVLALVFLAYAGSLSGTGAGAIGAVSLYFLVFLLVAALLRRLIARTKTFGGVRGDDPLLPVHTFALGAVSGGTIGLALAVEQFQLYYPKGNLPSVAELLALLGYSVDLVLLEAWAGLRFGRAMRAGFSWLPPFPVMGGEALGLLALSPSFLGASDVGDVALVVLFVGTVWALLLEEPRALRSLRKQAGLVKGSREKRFGRGGPRLEGTASPERKEGGREPTSAEGGAPSENEPPSTPTS